MAILGLALAGGAAAQQGPIQVQVMVSRISDAPGGIDARAQKLHQKLKGEFRYESLEVLEVRTLSLAVDQVGSVGLPTGKPARVRPLQVDGKGVLLAVQVEGVVSTDLRVQNGHLVVIGAGRHQGGKLVISLEPSW
jgi:hypothetical protein